MKTIRFDLHGLFNDEWATYEAFLIKIIKQIEAKTINLITLLQLLEANAALASEAMEIIRKSEFTRPCNELDKKRDHIIVSINHFVRSFLYEEEDALRNAAGSLMIVINHYAGMARENRDQQSNRIISFVDELTQNYADQVEILGDLERRLNQLSTANEQYIKLHDERVFAQAEKSTVRMLDVRREGDKIIRSIWDLTDVLLFTAPVPDVERFAAQLNVENQNIRKKLAARKGRKKNEGNE